MFAVHRLPDPDASAATAEGDVFLDRTAAVFQPYSPRTLSREDAREIAHNVTGLFALLLDLKRARDRCLEGDELPAPTPARRTSARAGPTQPATGDQVPPTPRAPKPRPRRAP